MRIVRLGFLALPLVVAACGHSGPSTPTLSITCDGSLALAGAASATVVSGAGGNGTTVTYPDPVNPGQTGSLPVVPGRACTIAPVVPPSSKS